MCVVSGNEVAKYCNSFSKVNPNGVDLSPTQITKLPKNLIIYFHREKRGYLDQESGSIVESKVNIFPNNKGFYSFEEGGLYELRFPKIKIPASCTGFAFPRSTVNRLGVIKFETAVFDSGYSGEPTQTFFTPLAALIHKDEALIQMVFIRNEEPTNNLYDGYYQNEKSH